MAFGLVAMMADAAPRTAAQALAIAREFTLQHAGFKGMANSPLRMAENACAELTRAPRGGQASPAGMIVNIGEDQGFIVVSGDDRFRPVLGYSTQGHVAEDESMPDGLRYWLSFLNAEMQAAIEAGYEDIPYDDAHAHQLVTRAAGETDYAQSVAPLLTTKWDQTAPYNNKIQSFATGCVATGMAQVMNYWKYPTKGMGSHTNAYFSTYSADFGATTYDWANMKDTYGGKYDTKAQIEAVSTLMLHLGIATDMRWAKPAVGSGTPNMYAGHALINFFSYNKYLYAEQRDCFSLGAWKNLVISQLQTGHPLCYAGMTGTAGAAGHFFVLDGYDAETGLFHFNWGWSGNCDGYYSITALEPGAGGTGAGLGSFNYEQQMFVNVQPTEIGEYVAHFDAKDIRANNSANKQKVVVDAASLSHNSLNFKGTAGLAVYDTDGAFLQFVPSNNGLPTGGFAPGSTYSGAYGFELNLGNLGDGNYTVCLAAQHEDYPGKVYPIRAYYGKPTYFTMTVSGSSVSFVGQQNDYSLQDQAEPVIVKPLAPNTLYQNVVSQFQITLKNTGTTVFSDEVGVCIKKSRESNPQYITVPCTLLPGEEKTVTLSGKVLRTPGSYKLYACYGEDGMYQVLSQSIDVTVDEEANALRPVISTLQAQGIYDLQGRRLDGVSGHSVNAGNPVNGQLRRGLYIKDGKKVIINK